MKMTRSVWLAGTLMVGAVGSAAAQVPRVQSDILFGVNVGLQPSARTFELNATPLVFGEDATFHALEGVDGSAMLDLLGGYRLTRNYWVVLGLTTTMFTKSEAFVTAQIPDPLFYDRRTSAVASLRDLKHVERSAHLSVMWVTPINRKIDLAILGGPSYLKVFQDLAQTVNVTSGTRDASPAGEQATATKLGFHIGGDATYLLTPGIGVGLMVRFVGASAELASVPSLKLGGLQYGGGLRLRF